MVRRPGIALVVSGACCAAASDAEAERARRGTDDETVRWGAVKAAAATTLRAVASMVGTGFQVLLDACPWLVLGLFLGPTLTLQLLFSLSLFPS